MPQHHQASLRDGPPLITAKRALRALAPAAAVDYRRRYKSLRHLGVTPSRAPRAAFSATFEEANLHYLRPGALRKVDAVIDIGANVGRWSHAVLQVCDPASVIAVEPSPQALPSLRHALEPFPCARIVPVAVGDHTGITDLYMTAHSHSTSVLQPRSREMDRVYGWGYQVDCIESVPMSTIDDIVGDVGQISILKIDVQGYEPHALMGATEALKRTKYVILEVVFQSHYVGDVLFPELHQMMVGAAFRLRALGPVSLRSNLGMWCDAVYESTAFATL